MADAAYAILDQRGVIAISGPDARDYLQGLVSNDVRKASGARTLYSAFLTPQGKYLFDFFLAEGEGGELLLDCEGARTADFVKRLSLYRLRSKVTVTDASDRFAVAALFGEGAIDAVDLDPEPGLTRPLGGGVVHVDPRAAEAGARAILPRDLAAEVLRGLGLAEADADAYDRHRLGLGLPDGSRDLPVERAILLENGFDEMHGVDWDKGCYMGQELTARTRYRALIKKRLTPVAVEGPMPAPDTPLMLGDKEAGKVRSGRDGMALAMIRLEYLDAGHDTFAADGATVRVKRPVWAAA